MDVFLQSNIYSMSDNVCDKNYLWVLILSKFSAGVALFLYF